MRKDNNLRQELIVLFHALAMGRHSKMTITAERMSAIVY